MKKIKKAEKGYLFNGKKVRIAVKDDRLLQTEKCSYWLDEDGLVYSVSKPTATKGRYHRFKIDEKYQNITLSKLNGDNLEKVDDMKFEGQDVYRCLELPSHSGIYFYGNLETGSLTAVKILLKILTYAKDRDDVEYTQASFSFNGRAVTLRMHRLTAETWIPKPETSPYDTISNADWAKTPESVRVCFYKQYEVDHIDEDHDNFHPSNLDWVMPEENIQRHNANSSIDGSKTSNWDVVQEELPKAA